MDNDAEEQAAGRGVRYRVVVERSVLDLPHGLTELTAALGRDEQVQVVDRVPTRLVVADCSLATVQPLTGLTTRLQWGRQACERGWVSREGSR
ncbi:hypothetical protein Scel_08800 [Streptomyces cellostaticus]|nr:hypothetical protein Scel_08800 [Streptomyces cellostaticus]